MQKSCTNCTNLTSIIDEQKSKIQLLETRLKDVLRAYKLICKEKDELITMNSSLNIDVDCRQQKRITELEENVVHLSGLCGSFESERKQLQNDIHRLEQECDSLKKDLDKVKFDETKQSDVVEEKISKNKSCQTEVFQIQETFHHETMVKRNNEIKIKQIDASTETETPYRIEAIVTPFKHVPDSPIETNVETLNRTTESISPNSDRSQWSANNEPSGSNENASGSSGVSLFYINELARKEIEIAEYRLRVREYECSLREIQWKYNNDKYRLQSRISDLETLNSNFILPKDKFGQSSSNKLNNINVAYIKNVLIKLLDTKEKEKKEIMIKALITAINSMQTSC